MDTDELRVDSAFTAYFLTTKDTKGLRVDYPSTAYFFNHEKHERTRNFCFWVAVVTTEHAEYTEISFCYAKSRDERLLY